VQPAEQGGPTSPVDESRPTKNFDPPPFGYMGKIEHCSGAGLA